MPRTRIAPPGNMPPNGEPDRVSIEHLKLDAENPRLALSAKNDSPTELTRVLWTEMAVDEVAWSIARNGYYESEPLLVIPSATPKENEHQDYVVVEGNRRLAAARLLRDGTLRTEVGATDLPKIDRVRYQKLGMLPVIKYASRKALWTEVGFRHINGTKPWDSFSKAKYIASVFGRYCNSLDEIADKIGDRHSTVRRLYLGYVLYKQAEDQTGFDVSDTVRGRLYFSHLYTAADQTEFQQFLGIDPDKSLRENPVKKAKLPCLAELMLWLYGSKSQNRPPVIRTQNPDLNNLRLVLGKPEALAELRRTGRLHLAVQTAIGDRQIFVQALAGAKSELKNVKATVVTGYKGSDDEWVTMREVVDLATSARDDMERLRSQGHKQR